VGLDFSSEIFLSDIAWFHPTVDIGHGLAPGSYDFQLAFGRCVALADGPNAVCSFRGILTEDADNLFVGVGPATESSVDGIGPAWIGCPATEQLLLFRTGTPQALAINHPVAVTQTTWSEIKALYR
jgi:hypothetical protein